MNRNPGVILRSPPFGASFRDAGSVRFSIVEQCRFALSRPTIVASPANTKVYSSSPRLEIQWAIMSGSVGAAGELASKALIALWRFRAKPGHRPHFPFAERLLARLIVA